LTTRYGRWTLLPVLLFGLVAPVLPARAASPSPLKMVVYYFHATKRCATCMAIENLSKEIVETRYGAQLKAGVVQWQSVDVQQPNNRQFIQQYRLVSSSLVLVRVDNGKKGRWQTLDKTWLLIRKKNDFTQYVQSSIDRFLED
jgi:hypothetical protein